mgnify:FL=1
MFDGIKNFTIRMIAGANVASIILMMVVGYSDHLSPERFALLSTIGLMFPLFLLINSCFLFFWLIVKVRYALIPFLGFLLCYVPVRNYIPFNLNGDVPEDAIKVLSFNTLNFAEGRTNSEGINPIVAYLRDQNADIVCLQEAVPSPSEWEQIDSILRPIYPHIDTIAHPNGGNGLMVLSKFPICGKELIPYSSKGNLSAAFRLTVKGREVLLVNNHLETTGLSIEERRQFKKLVKGSLENDSAEQTSKLLIVKLAESTKKRAPEADSVSSYVRRYSGESVILCGDFNDSPISYAHRTIAQGLTDCFVESGNGLGISYHRGGFYVRIDNIMCSKDWKPYGCQVDDKITVSDHYPMICYLKMQSKH